MKKRYAYPFIFLALIASASVLFTFTVFGDGQGRRGGPSDDRREDKKEANKFGPFHSTSPDNGSCGQQWAEDTFDRVFKVKDNKDGTFRVTEEFKRGMFTTTGPVSPGACEPDSRHGMTVLPGVLGKFNGVLEGTVTGGTLNANGCDATGTPCDSTAGFIAATFGPGATFSCFAAGPNDCRFRFEYSAPDQGLIFHHWVDASDNNGNEFFRGDIANQ